MPPEQNLDLMMMAGFLNETMLKQTGRKYTTYSIKSSKII